MGITAALTALGISVLAQPDSSWLCGGWADWRHHQRAAALRDAVTGIASSAAEWFKEKLGIASPSRVFMEYGGWIGRGGSAGHAGWRGRSAHGCSGGGRCSRPAHAGRSGAQRCRCCRRHAGRCAAHGCPATAGHARSAGRTAGCRGHLQHHHQRRARHGTKRPWRVRWRQRCSGSNAPSARGCCRP